MSAKFYVSLAEFRAVHGDALARCAEGLRPDERARFEAILAEQAMADLRAELLDLAWALLRVMHGRIAPRA